MLADVSGHSLRLRQGESFGALWTVDQLARQLGIKKALGVTPEAELSCWQVLARVLRPGTSLLAMVRLTTTCAAASLLGWRRAFTEDDLYTNGAWLEGRHGVTERRLWQARPTQRKDQLFLCDVTSSHWEGDYNALAAWGYNRDHKEGKKRVVVGLLTDSQGEPVSIRVCRGNTSDLKTFGQQVHKIKKELGGEGVTLAGDRGMIRTDPKAVAQKAEFHFVTALTKPQIQKLLADKVLQLELFEEQVHEVLGEDGRRFVLRRNPVRQEELQRAREQKQPALEAALKKANTHLEEHPRAKAATQRRHLAARLESLQVQDWLKLTVNKQRLVLSRDAQALQAAAQLDGCYVVETDLKTSQADAQTIHDRYKDLAFVERDFRTLKSGHLEFRPWFVCTEDHTQAHALTSMLALKVRRQLDPSSTV
jgi:transposase